MNVSHDRAAGTSVLLVEDEFVLALSERELLEGLGYRVLGPVATSSAALAILREQTPQLGILDVKLRDGTAGRIASRLRRRGIPYVVATGCDLDDIGEPALLSVPLLKKPISDGELARTLQLLRRLP